MFYVFYVWDFAKCFVCFMCRPTQNTQELQKSLKRKRSFFGISVFFSGVFRFSERISCILGLQLIYLCVFSSLIRVVSHIINFIWLVQSFIRQPQQPQQPQQPKENTGTLKKFKGQQEIQQLNKRGRMEGFFFFFFFFF